jgi:hypothetical protein
VFCWGAEVAVGFGVASSPLDADGLATAIAATATTAVALAAMLAPILVLRFILVSLRVRTGRGCCGRDPTVAAPGRRPIEGR